MQSKTSALLRRFTNALEAVWSRDGQLLEPALRIIVANVSIDGLLWCHIVTLHAQWHEVDQVNMWLTGVVTQVFGSVLFIRKWACTHPIHRGSSTRFADATGFGGLWR